MFRLVWDLLQLGCGFTLFVALLKGGFSAFRTLCVEITKVIAKAIAKIFSMINDKLEL